MNIIIYRSSVAFNFPGAQLGYKCFYGVKVYFSIYLGRKFHLDFILEQEDDKVAINLCSVQHKKRW